MIRSIARTAFLSAVTLGLSSVALAQSSPDFGKNEYQANCAVCHGVNGEGGGPYASMFMKNPPSDLTMIAKKNGGVFPVMRVYEIIDGRGAEITAHGPRHMPIWGADYVAKAGESLESYPVDYYPVAPEAFARIRILMLTDYLNRIQKK